MTFTAILLAGSRPGRDPFAERFGTDMKALIPIAGEPMVCRPVRALLGAKVIGEVIVLSQAPGRIAAVVPSDERVQFRESRGTIAETMLELCEDPDTRWPLLVTTADHALLTANSVDEFCKASAGGDIAIGIVRRESLIRRLPGTERTWMKFRGGAYTGANLFVLASPDVRPAIELWRKTEQGRKKPWRVMSVLGPGLLLRLLLGRLSIDEAMRRIGRRLGLRIKAVRLSNPLAGVDVDKPSDHDLVEAILRGTA